MKLKKKIIAFMALISLGTFFCGAKGSANIVQAKTNTIFFPKKMRGTWYQYYNKKISKMTITKNKEVHHYINGTKNIRYLEKKPTIIPETSQKTKNRFYISRTRKVHGYTWYGINKITLPADLTEEYYGVAKIKGNWVFDTALAHGNVFESDNMHWYRTPELAKRLKNAHYKNFDFSFSYNDLE